MKHKHLTATKALTPLEKEILLPLHIRCQPKVKEIYYEGEFRQSDSKRIAIVGARNMTEYGVRACREFARVFAQSEITVVSGLMYGIDSLAHFTALDYGGRTFAVLGYGHQHIRAYPYATDCAKRIITQKAGVIISEYPPHQKPKSWTFPKRNRIIAGLSEAVLIIEAGMRSGRLITAGYALDQGKDVYVVPGSIYSSVSQGCHMLIKQGAILVNDPKELVERLG